MANYESQQANANMENEPVIKEEEKPELDEQRPTTSQGDTVDITQA